MRRLILQSGRMPSVAGFQYYVKHSLDFDRLAENEVYEIVKAFDQEFFKIGGYSARGC